MSTKRALKDVNVTSNDDGEDAATAVAKTKTKKTKTASSASVRTNDIQTIKSILNDIQDPTIKASLEHIIAYPTKSIAPKKLDDAAIDKMTTATIRTIQGLINQKLAWKGSYSSLRGSDATKGGRVEAVCSEPEVFKKIFAGATIKETKDGKLSLVSKQKRKRGRLICHFMGNLIGTIHLDCVHRTRLL